MLRLTVKEIVSVTGGKLLCGDENTEINDVCIDSRKIKEGDLFVPIIGNNIDPHRFIEETLKVGAATLTMRHNGVVIAQKPYIQVTDSVKALQDLGAYVRNQYNIPFVGITGSVGKTTTREMVAAVLNQCARVYQTAENHNSQIGVPITLVEIDGDPEVAVLEMGMSEEGQMDVLSKLVKPQICVVTVIGVAHIEYLKTRENIRKEKLTITNHMQENGTLFLNGDDEMLANMRGGTGVQTFFYGTKEWCDYRAENIHMENFKYVYDYVHGEKRVRVVLNALGKHNVGNSLVGLAIADHMGYDVERAAAGLAEFKGMRQRIINIPGKYTIIDDTYNASPDSMKASIDVLDELPCEGKKLALLGDMFELGIKSQEYHYEVGKHLAGKDIDILAVVGEDAKEIARAVEEAGSNMECCILKDNGEAVLFLLSVMSKDDIVLMKASNGMKFLDIVNNLLGR